MTLRIPAAFIAGLLVTAGMFWIMWILIAGTGSDINLRPATRIDFTPLKHDSAIESKRDKVERPKPQQVPEIPDMARTNFDAGDNNANFNMSVTSDVSMDGIQVSGGSDRDVIPLVRINPEYPRRAQSRGVEGWVQFEFTISTSGTVKDVRVIDSEPKGLFEDAATKAILRWKYNPKVEEGRAVERRGIRVVLRFDLED